MPLLLPSSYKNKSVLHRIKQCTSLDHCIMAMTTASCFLLHLSSQPIRSSICQAASLSIWYTFRWTFSTRWALSTGSWGPYSDSIFKSVPLNQEINYLKYTKFKCVIMRQVLLSTQDWSKQTPLHKTLHHRTWHTNQVYKSLALEFKVKSMLISGGIIDHLHYGPPTIIDTC